MPLRLDALMCRTFSLSALALVAALGGCARPVDVVAAERAIRELDKTWVQAIAAQDTMAIANIFAEDGEFLPPGAPRVSGRAAVRSAWAQLVKAPHLSLTFEPAKVVVASAGDIAYASGRYQLGMDGPKGQRIEDVGKFVEAWKRVSNDWKVQYAILNSDKPAGT